MSKSMTTTVEHLSIFQYTRGREYEGNRFEISPRPERFKTYNGPCVRLKTSIRKGGEGSPTSGSLNGVEWLKRVMLPAFGVTSVKFHGHESELLWSFPSAGGCYPVEVYVAVRRLDGVQPGLYHYNALHASLYWIEDEHAAERVRDAQPAATRDADVCFILSIVPWRTCWKYAHKGYRFGMIDAGHVAANLQLVLRSLGWQFAAYTNLRSEELSALLKLDALEVPIAMIAASAGSPMHGDHETRSAVPPQRLQIAERGESLDDAEAQLFNWAPIFEFQERVNRTVPAPSDDWLTRLSLPEEWTDYDQLLPLLIDRRSSAAFERCELPIEDLNTMLMFIEKLELLPVFYLIVHDVKGLPSGVYQYAKGDLRCMREGDFRDLSAGICLGQTFLKDCSVLFVFTVDIAQISKEEFSQYQQSSIDGGGLGQLIHLKTEEMGLGFSVIGGFYDDEFRELLQLSSSHQIVYAGAWGRNAPNASEARKHDRYVMNRPQS
ncbi:SagB-type dehydrogenase domain protein [Paenibacillus curdlanolyticus YK9]|uniref:SagB-type dehydrogenase domain protein n=1 Tax=Paenibacillus curdlanolyticus YK9 TaxID=717606 RepID=E0IG97_9BACL|nr:SagB family peptide dehydrogenase [Paenibacillus curdlanolyticus]EFM08499.1 SagB-type dehydrogenase domain protein [Paenibacillus curdlanolyticus YK9]